MNARVTSILEEARKLTLDEREELVLRLQVELDKDESEGTPEEIEAAWMEEVERRAAAFERGETTSRPADEVHARIREYLKRL